jgi:hypothetical protein
MGYRNGYDFVPRRLEQTLTAERLKYLDAKINAAIGLCREPRHPLDHTPEQSQKRLSGASHQYMLGMITRSDCIR